MTQKFLIVSNNKTLTSMVQKALGDDNHAAICAEDGLEAVDMALDRKPAAVFLDVKLTHLTGLEVARALRAITPTAQMPIIFLADNPADARKVADARLPYTDCLVAPFDAAQIRRCAADAPNGAPNGRARPEAENTWMIALLDPLTGLYHRRYFLHRLAYEAARSARYRAPLALLLVDIDNLNEINQHYGIVTGDAVLMEAAETLRQLTRASDLVGRCDTQDFGVLAPQVDEQGACELAARISGVISAHHFVHAKLDLHVTVSIGVVYVPGDDLTVNLALLGRAENALQNAKRAGKNRVEVG
ncbi:MAG: diguanylate cyclase [Chloroflexi bacterium]|nr:diguanylate cyclase [Chloroflexota bacterium]